MTDSELSGQVSYLGARLTGNELTELQRKAQEHVAFSLTEACPLRCRHCLVAAVRPRDRLAVTLTPDLARRLARELPALASQGVRRLSFTGGEPLLVPVQLELLSAAAAALGIESTVVTSCFWAATERSALRTLRRFAHIRKWHLSTDCFHAEFVDPDTVVRTAAIAYELGHDVTVRLAVRPTPSEKEQRLIDHVSTHLPEGVGVAVQPLSRVGRGGKLRGSPRLAAAPLWPCTSLGMLVHFDGTVSPCCSALSAWKRGHPFEHGRAGSTHLVQLHERWRADPLLRLMRAAGFSPLLSWLREDHPHHPLLTATPRHPCDTCLALWSDPAVGRSMRRRCEKPEVKEKIGRLYEAVFIPDAKSPEAARGLRQEEVRA